MNNEERQERYGGKLIENEWEFHVDEEGAEKFYEKRCPNCEHLYQVLIPNKSEGSVIAERTVKGEENLLLAIEELEAMALAIAICPECIRDAEARARADSL